MEKIVLNSRNCLKVTKKTVRVLKSGGLIVFPSDTVYGLGVDPKSKEAVSKLFQIKSRDLDKAVSVLVTDQKMAEDYVVLNKTAKNFYHNFLPGPFTVVSEIKEPSQLQFLIYAYNKTLGIRIPKDLFLIGLSKAFDGPITATSANISGKSPHYTVDGFLKTLSQKRRDLIDLVINAGKLPRRKPSTVVDLSQGKIQELRKGEISFSQEKKYQSLSPAESKSLAKKIIKEHYQKNRVLILALIGDLGAGKTTFCQGIGEYFDIRRVNSPTFNLSKEYCFNGGVFYHIDTYRMESDKELLHLGFKDMLQPGNIIAIEWAQKVKDILIDLKDLKVVWLFLKHDNGQDKNKREIKEFS